MQLMPRYHSVVLIKSGREEEYEAEDYPVGVRRRST
jgi:hypothetical protein